MNCRQLFLDSLNFRAPSERLPMVEWAAWWDLTFNRWRGEGLPEDITWEGSLAHFGLDPLYCLAICGCGPGTPAPAGHGQGIIGPDRSYDDILPYLYSDAGIEGAIAAARSLRERHEKGDVIIRLWLDGFFWFPRSLLGIEPHLFAFHDQPDLLHRINSDLAAYNARAVDALFPVLRPDMVGFAEDMSYNHGPMLSKRQFDEFVTPYYRQVVPHIAAHDVRVLIDSDGDISKMVPWMEEAGIEGVYPLERQAGVDVAAIRAAHPRFLMMGGYDKMVMPMGEDAMRAEFERLLPVMRSGGFIPSVDHQTPPGVSLENYRIYVRLFHEYAVRAAS